MAPRLNKRQIRELDELEELERNRLAAAAEEETIDEDEPTANSAFAALNEEDEVEEVEDLIEVEVKSKKSKSKKKKKKPAPTELAEITPIVPPMKKSTAKNARAAMTADDGMDDIDRALAELGMAKSRMGTVEDDNKKMEPKWEAVKELFVIDPKHLDAEAELRRFFGSKVINTTPIAATRSGHHPRFANNPHHSTSIRRTASHLVTPEAGWAPLAANGLSLTRYTGIEALEEPSSDWYTYEHSTDYRSSQLAFLQVLQSADGNKLFDVLQRNPYSVDTLLQLAEMSTQQGDLGAASTYLSKALYAISGPLPTSFLAGSFRLSYARVENRSFYLAVARKVALLVKRGTWRTAMEWSKIALGAGGAGDPVGMLLYIDFLAPKSKQNDWFLSFLTKLPIAYPSINLESYPGLAYGKALCLRNIEEDKSQNDEKSTAALVSAIIRFPMVASLLYSTVGGNVPPKILSHRRAQVDGRYSPNSTYLLSLLSELYVVRSTPLWKEPSTLAWFHQTTLATADSLDDSSLPDVVIGERLFLQGPWETGYAPAGIIRAAFISDIPSIRPYLPPAALSGTSYSYDPIPPTANSVTTFFDNEYFAPVALERSRAPTRAQRAARAAGRDEELRRTRAGVAQLEQILNTIDLTDDLRRQLLDELSDARRNLGEREDGFATDDDEADDMAEEEGEEGEIAGGGEAGGVRALFRGLFGGAAV